VAAAISAFVSPNTKLLADVRTQAASSKDRTADAAQNIQPPPPEAPAEASAAATSLQLSGVHSELNARAEISKSA